jgi:hypothetical protein
LPWNLAEARDTRVQRLRQADRALESLAHFVGQHAYAVDGDDRARLVRIGEEQPSDGDDRSDD